jgi:hypothetical protein
VHRDVLGEGAYGLLFPVGDAEALKALLERASGRPDELRAKADAGRDALMARYGAVPFWQALSAEIATIRGERR